MNMCFRSSVAICEEAQIYRDRVGIDNMKIVPATDVRGKVVEARFWSEPINLEETTRILGRSSAHAVTFYQALLAMGIPCRLSGAIETSQQLMLTLNELPGTLTAVVSKLEIILHNAPTDDDDSTRTREMYEALAKLVHVYLQLPDAVDANTIDAREAFCEWLRGFYAPTDGGKGIFVIETMRKSKSGQADSVYLINWAMMPLKDRIDKGGWEENEELCLAYVAATRARSRLIKLPLLEEITVEAVKELFNTPVQGQYVTQPEATMESDPSDDEAAGAAPGGAAAPNDAITAALAALELAALPTSTEELDACVRRLMRAHHTDRNLGKEKEAQGKSQAILAARRHIMKILASA